LAGAGGGFHWINLKKGDDRQGKKKIKSRNQRGGIDDHCLRRALALLPSASSEARRRLRRRTILVWDVHCLQKG
jgi:hypothetical protein